MRAFHGARATRRRAESAHHQPTLCHLPPIRFTVVHRSPDASVEVRDYAPSVWATTTLPAGAPWKIARADGFKRLFDFISAHGIAMTTPVVYRVSPGPDGAMKAAFLLPDAARATAPRSDGPVTVEEWPAMRVAARSWAGSPDGRGVVDRQASEAAKTAAAAGFGTASPQSSPYYFAGYDGPMTPAAERRHEVWVPVTAAPPAVAPQVAIAG